MLPASNYKNFVKASVSLPLTSESVRPKYYVSGEEAQRIYLNEVKDASTSTNKLKRPIPPADIHNNAKKSRREKVQLNERDYFVAAQNNDLETLKNALKHQPEMLNAVDEFGWSLLMIACQSNSVKTAEVLINLGADTSIRDKAGNSARSLVIKNKNLQIAGLLLNNAEDKCPKKIKDKPKTGRQKKLHVTKYTCEICSSTYPDKEQHLVSTVHNINASKGKKIHPCYKLPETNKGFQIMLKTGWDKGSGLGYDGSGIQYPIRVIQKKDRKGIGHDDSKTKVGSKEEIKFKQLSKKLLQREERRNKNIEINFRREFY